MKMRRHLPMFKSLLLAFALTAIAIGLALAPRSAAKSDRPATQSDSPISQVQDEKGTIVAKLKDYDPKVHGFSFKNYGRDHEGPNDLTAADLMRMFGAENVCESGSTA